MSPSVIFEFSFLHPLPHPIHERVLSTLPPECIPKQSPSQALHSNFQRPSYNPLLPELLRQPLTRLPASTQPGSHPPATLRPGCSLSEPEMRAHRYLGESTDSKILNTIIPAPSAHNLHFLPLSITSPVPGKCFLCLEGFSFHILPGRMLLPQRKEQPGFESWLCYFSPNDLGPAA